MNIGSVIYTIVIKPLELLFEVIFSSVYMKSDGDVLLTIIIMSLAVNFLVLPLYYRADIIQKIENNKKKSLKKWEDHIKSHFKGDEQFMILQAYYRQNDYKPYQTLNNALPLFLEIPFFIAAYHFLSNLKVLNGISLWKINDLSSPDGLVSIGGIAINVLPIVMTLINIISLEVYGTDAGIKNKLKMYAMAVVFLILLYNSPSVLCMYWTFNNIFSLFKNIVYKIADNFNNKRDKSENPDSTLKLKLLKLDNKGSLILFFMAFLLIISYAGLYIPAKILVSSPEDFISKNLSDNPVSYIINCVLIYLGIFFWFSVIYYMSSKLVRYIITEIIIIVSIINVFNYSFMIDQGRMSKYFVYSKYTDPNLLQQIQGLVFVLGISIVVHFIILKKKKILFYPLIAALGVFVFSGVINANKINNIFKAKKEIMDTYCNDTEIHLSKDGKNVVVIMMDRMVSQYIPYFINEKPELLSQFSGFTYYPNSISFGVSTNAGSPGLYGGYEYIPQESNKRKDILLKDKQNEALKVMPVMFNNSGFNVRVSDPTYANYDWIPDLSIYNDYPDIITSISMGRMNNDNDRYNVPYIFKRNLFFHSLYCISPVFLKKIVYQDGNYYNLFSNYGISNQLLFNNHKSIGITDDFYDSYNVLDKMDDITVIENNNSNNFFMMSNDLTHSPNLLQEPDYDMNFVVDNTWYDNNNPIRTNVYGEKLEIFKDKDDKKDKGRVLDYHIGMVAMIKLGEWFQYLKDNNIYDNTRIIIVSDHSSDELFDDKFNYYVYTNGEPDYKADMHRFQCTLLVKDFNSEDFMFNDDFMTNADVPALAIDGLLKDNTNPFTGKTITTDYKNSNELQLQYTRKWSTDTNNGYTFLPEHWFTVHDNIFDENNWKYLGYY